MVTQKIVDAYERMAERFDELIEHNPHNAYYDRPNTLKLVPKVAGQAILDAACGPGKYAEILMAQGAKVTGFDISPKMIELAKKRNENSGQFFVHDLSKPLKMCKNQSFDIVMCALALNYIKDWNLTIKEFYRVLKPKGHLIISVEHPFFEYNYFKSKKYFEIEHVTCTWSGYGKPVEINSFRRPLNACLMSLTNNRFYIDKLVEPKPTKEFEKLDPKHFKELNDFPAFMCMRGIRKWEE